jgi:hypothetical protein
MKRWKWYTFRQPMRQEWDSLSGEEVVVEMGARRWRLK